MKTIVTGDLYNIVGRLQEVDPGYYVKYDYRLRRYEVHHNGQKGNTLCVVLPYDKLDARTVVHIQRTRAERRDQLIREMDKRNRELEKTELKKVVRKAERASFG